MLEEMLKQLERREREEQKQQRKLAAKQARPRKTAPAPPPLSRALSEWIRSTSGARCARAEECPPARARSAASIAHTYDPHERRATAQHVHSSTCTCTCTYT